MAGVRPYGCFTHAVVRGVPESFGQTAEGGDTGNVQTDLAKAQRQFGVLMGALRQKVGLQLIEIPPDSQLPESWRMEDVAVIQGDTALIARPWKQQRCSEVKLGFVSVRISEEQLWFHIVEVHQVSITCSRDIWSSYPEPLQGSPTKRLTLSLDPGFAHYCVPLCVHVCLKRMRFVARSITM